MCRNDNPTRCTASFQITQTPDSIIALTRGSKGVGATYLAYGFNSLKIASRLNDRTFSVLIEGGRDWVEDNSGTLPRPKIVRHGDLSETFHSIDRGTSVTLTLSGDNIRPKNLTWYQATTADQWLALLRIMTPIGGIYLKEAPTTQISVSISVISNDGTVTEAKLDRPKYLLPHDVITKSGSIHEFLADQKKKLNAGADLSKIPPKFSGLNGLWGAWRTDELLGEIESDCPIRVNLSGEERQLAKQAGVNIYVYMAFSTDLWDLLNDKTLKLRKGIRVLKGGLQLATRNMPQGTLLTIPMTNNIGFQNLAHVIVHFDEAEPDLGRKGFQPEFTDLAEKISVSAVTAFRRRYNLLRKPGAARIFSDEVKINDWIRDQEYHEKSNALVISGKGLFLPTEELPIRSEPRVEQDVVALFNQMLSSGIIRGIQLIASSQYNQYDGLYRVEMKPPYEKFIVGEDNPLGIENERLTSDEGYKTNVKVLEYKHTLDGLIEEIQSGVKDAGDIGLAVAWELGQKWRELFDVTSYLDDETSHHRQIHGTTHSFVHAVSGVHVFEAIILRDLTNYLRDPDAEVLLQREKLEWD